MSELFYAAGFVSIIAVLFSVLVSFRSGQPLVEWINPGRHYLPALTLALLVSAGGMLWRASLKYQKSQLELLTTLVTHDTAPLDHERVVAQSSPISAASRATTRCARDRAHAASPARARRARSC